MTRLQITQAEEKFDLEGGKRQNHISFSVPCFLGRERGQLSEQRTSVDRVVFPPTSWTDLFAAPPQHVCECGVPTSIDNLNDKSDASPRYFEVKLSLY